jgi:hypothetical protein
LPHLARDNRISYADRSLKDEQILISKLLRESKHMDMADGLKLKSTFYFMERIHEPLHLVKLSFVHHEHTYKFYLNHYFL